jgi:hypothetical protein
VAGAERIGCLDGRAGVLQTRLPSRAALSATLHHHRRHHHHQPHHHRTTSRLFLLVGLLRRLLHRRLLLRLLPPKQKQAKALQQLIVYPANFRVAAPEPKDFAAIQQDLKQGSFSFPERKGWLYRRTGGWVSSSSPSHYCLLCCPCALRCAVVSVWGLVSSGMDVEWSDHRCGAVLLLLLVLVVVMS